MSMFGPFFEPSEEQKAAASRMQARSEDLMNRFKRLVSEELSPEQLEVVHAMLSHIANAGTHSTSVANWYEGMLLAVTFVRDIRLGEALDNPLLTQMGSHVAPPSGAVEAAVPVDEDEDEDDMPPDPFTSDE